MINQVHAGLGLGLGQHFLYTPFWILHFLTLSPQRFQITIVLCASKGVITRQRVKVRTSLFTPLPHARIALYFLKDHTCNLPAVTAAFAAIW